MHAYPLTSLTLEQAQAKQFALVDCITRHFPNSQFLHADLGLATGLNQPATTARVEQVLAAFFNAESAVLLQGAGTGALRAGLNALLTREETLLVHQAPIYPTSKVSIEQLGCKVVQADFNNLSALDESLALHKPSTALIQHTRQRPQDSYALAEVIAHCAQHGVSTLIDDNYATLKVPAIGCELGATLSTFSSFKLFGPEGVGVAMGVKSAVDAIKQTLYSGGCQIQGWQALAVLRGMVFAPVMHAIAASQGEQIVERLNQGECPQVKNAYIVNAQSKVVIVELAKPIAPAVIEHASHLGALGYPVGAESKYELPPLFYRVSGTFLAQDPNARETLIRINPNRSGADTVIRILKESIQAVESKSAV
ncbi:aminotransferase class V-fold PLP-dependent enzyme [Pasteurellaceae bacterium HPA106]|uniref:aminotransferase class V-fold PLP-dependent enzyme n=1 Tax=Spirabiliibacterium pneumoniae TaxID=221400 RepID=UPI001AAE0C94|nr:aminotransferase class V-fold PLP-dependent enzyme [Spirabiliibacterium pneumoniae]MBE2896036.1 aminotransferase class V-fold PLP-dependent enzyme [Spirabiliibacterium pneumoniae]